MNQQVLDERAQMRVNVAKDVLSRINTIQVKSGEYIFSPQLSYLPLETINDNAQKYVDKIQSDCQVCALGACVLSYVRLYNKVTIKEMGYDDYFERLNPKNKTIRNILKNIFSDVQILLIESAFESENHDVTFMYEDVEESYGDSVEKAVLFGNEYRTLRDKLEAIMINIIQNNGEFVP
jgi:hypothetical protein